MGDVVIVVGAKSSLSALTSEDAKKVFMARKRILPNGLTAAPVLQKDASNATKVFRERVLKKSAAQLRAYWAKLIFSGKGSPPPTVKSGDEVKEYVANTPGGIGYMDEADLDPSVKVVHRIAE